MRKQTQGLVAILVALAVSLLGWQLWRARSPAPVAAAPEQAPASGPSAAGAPKPAAAGAAPARPVEPMRADYRNPQLAQLKRSADAGDSRAACRLGMELLRCTDVSAAEQVLAASTGQEPAGMPPEQRAYMQKLVGRARQLVEECRSAPTDAWQQGSHYLRQAALAGEPEAMYRYARGDSVLVDYSRMDTPEFDRWRKEAAGMLELSFEAGYLPSLFDLMVAYSDNSSPITGLVPNDPTKARAMRLLIGRLAGKPADPPEPRHAGLESSAAALAAQWQRDYFASVRVPLEKMPRVMPAGFAALYADENNVPACSQ